MSLFVSLTWKMYSIKHQWLFHTDNGDIEILEFEQWDSFDKWVYMI